MSKIKKLLNDKSSILVFDVDGVLAIMEFGDRNHYYHASDEEWDKQVDNGLNLYTKDKVSKRMQNFLKNKDLNKIYVITTIGVNNEAKYKKKYLEKYYGIYSNNIYFVNKNRDKTSKLIEIRNLNKNVNEEHIIMIDDTTDILSDIQNNTNFSTAHISSFLDI